MQSTEIHHLPPLPWYLILPLIYQLLLLLLLTLFLPLSPQPCSSLTFYFGFAFSSKISVAPTDIAFHSTIKRYWRKFCLSNEDNASKVIRPSVQFQTRARASLSLWPPHTTNPPRILTVSFIADISIPSTAQTCCCCCCKVVIGILGSTHVAILRFLYVWLLDVQECGISLIANQSFRANILFNCCCF